MEKGPNIKIVGNASLEKKEEKQKKVLNYFFNQYEALNEEDREILKKLEYSKSEKEIILIDFVNQETNKLMEEFGFDGYDIPKNNYHIIPLDLYKKLGGVGSYGSASFSGQNMIFSAEKFRDNSLLFGLTSFHETLHLKGFTSFGIWEKGDNKGEKLYRSGISVRSVAGFDQNEIPHEHFDGLHEAIVSTQEGKFFKKLLELPEMEEERKRFEDPDFEKIKEEISDKFKISKEEIVWINPKNKEDFRKISYLGQRKTLNYIAGEIQKQFPDKFKIIDDVLKEFLKIHFTGNFINIARLVEGTFGEGSFRILGNMDTDENSANLHLELFKYLRRKELKNKKI